MTGNAAGAESGVRVTGSLTALGAEPTRADIVLIEDSPGRRAVRALAALGACWAAAAFAVFIPVAHFVLVPTLLGAGVLLAFMRLRQHRRLESVRGRCPRCAAYQEFEPMGRFRRELRIHCPACHNYLTLITERPTNTG